jgi:hypothetical protein
MAQTYAGPGAMPFCTNVPFVRTEICGTANAVPGKAEQLRDLVGRLRT